MNYKHVLSAFAAEPWAMQPEKLDALCRFVSYKANGGDFTAEEVAARIGKKPEPETVEKDGSVAVIPVYGVLAQRMNMMSEISGGTSYQQLSKQIRAAIASNDVKAVILDIDSPGGAVSGCQELVSEIMSLRANGVEGGKKIVAQVNSLAASAAYWIAAACDEIVVSPSARAGSIGVYTVHEDVSKMLADDGVKLTYIHAGKYKVEGNQTEPLGKEAKDFIQEGVDRSYKAFVDGVAAGRGVSSAKVKDSFGQGRVYGAEDLVERGMADRIGTLSETLEEFGATDRPEILHRIRNGNASRAEAAEVLSAKMKAGEHITKREFENGLKGLVGMSNSEAERAARLYLKTDQGDPDDDGAQAELLEKIKAFKAEAESFVIKI